MTMVYMFSGVDRSLMILLLQPIKQDFLLSDTQLGFLTGIAFGLFYATVGLPIARWADVGNRARIAALAIGVWGVTMAACLFVTNYLQLVLARIAAAVGESGGKPPTYSLVGDYYPQPAERTRAMAAYMTGSPLSSLLTFSLAGWLSEHYGWRAAFLIMGVPGLILAVLVVLTIEEPRLSGRLPKLSARSPPPISVVLKILWQRRALRHLCFALILLYTMGLGMAPWYAAFMMRVHGMGTIQVGLWFGAIFGFGGIAGSLCGGHVAARWFGSSERMQMKMSAIAVALLVPCFVGFLLSPGKIPALACLTLLLMTFSFYLGPAYAVLQRLVPDEMRSTMLATVMLFANLIGFGIGPQVVGIISDVLLPVAGKESLRFAMLAMSFVAFWAAYHFWQVGHTVQDEIAAVGAEGSSPIG